MHIYIFKYINFNNELKQIPYLNTKYYVNMFRTLTVEKKF